MAQFEPPPTYAPVIIFPDNVPLERAIKLAKFNPIWLKWFIDVAQFFNASGGTAGSGVVTSGGPNQVGIYGAAGTTITGSDRLPAANFPQLTGDVTTAAGALATTLATVNGNVGSFISANITVNAKGLITAAASGGGSALSAITAAGAANTIASGNHAAQVWNWALTADAEVAFSFGETTAATNGTSTGGVPNQSILEVHTKAGSTAAPLAVYSGGNYVFSVIPDGRQILVAPGTVAAPIIALRGEEDTGLSWSFGTFKVIKSATQIFRVTDTETTVSSGTTSAPGLNDITSGTTGLSWPNVNELSVVDTTQGGEWVTWKAGHAISKGSSPTITAGGGTSPSIVGKDEAFTVTIGTGGIATSVEVTFATAFTTNPPVCCADSDTDIIAVKVAALTTKVTITAAVPFTAGSKLNVLCKGWE